MANFFFDVVVNTAARMESNGKRNGIHVSSETAEQLRGGGKGHWLVKRSDKVVAKGKGLLETYWLEMKQQSSGSQHSGRSTKSGASTTSGTSTDVANTAKPAKTLKGDTDIDEPVLPAKIKRLVKWNADVLLRILKLVVARREALEQLNLDESGASNDFAMGGSQYLNESSRKGATAIDEVIDIIQLPKFNAKAAKIQRDAKDIEIDPKAIQQLHDYITVIASMYRVDVPFHNVSVRFFSGRVVPVGFQLTVYPALPPIV
jgi:Adenylate and Guanylate cyclase catalytic domain